MTIAQLEFKIILILIVLIAYMLGRSFGPKWEITLTPFFVSAGIMTLMLNLQIWVFDCQSTLYKVNRVMIPLTAIFMVVGAVFFFGAFHRHSHRC